MNSRKKGYNWNLNQKAANNKEAYDFLGHSGLVSLQKSSHPKLFPGDIVEYRRNKYFSHFGVYYGDRDGVPYVAHLTCRGTNSPISI